MGYQAEKEKVESKLKRVKTVVLCVTLAALLFLCVFSAFVPPDTWKYHVGKPRIAKIGEGELRIHFIDVGQGDCQLIEFPDGKVALIDGGDGRESTETTVLRYLNALKIDTIDYLVVSHDDADHCGALDKVLEQKKILNAYLPATKPENSNSEYAQFFARLLEEACTLQYSKSYLDLGNQESENGYSFVFLYPNLVDADTAQEDDNENSAVLWLDYQGVSALFTGDAPFSTEGALMRDDRLGLYEFLGVDLTSTEILKVAHHGSADGTSAEFLEYLRVKTAIVSCAQIHPRALYRETYFEIFERVSTSRGPLPGSSFQFGWGQRTARRGVGETLQTRERARRILSIERQLYQFAAMGQTSVQKNPTGRAVVFAVFGGGRGKAFRRGNSGTNRKGIRARRI